MRSYPIKFYRQRTIGDYIVDFYCAKAKLVIELDGGGHYTNEQEKADALRTAELEKKGLKVIRICNIDIDKNFGGVCEYIKDLVKTNYPTTAKAVPLP